jgi:hypothetical protein
VAGETGGALPGQTNAGGIDAFVRKYDSDGNETWTRQFGTVGTDQAFAIFAFWPDVYVAGLTNGSFPGETNAGGFDIFLRKYDVNGSLQWTRQFGTPGFDEALGLFVDATGVYLSGEVDGALPGQAHAGTADAFVRKYDHAGNELWTRQFGTSASDVAFKIAGHDYGIYVVGRTGGALPGQTHLGMQDAFVRKYDASGNEIWTRQFGTATNDIAIGTATDPSGVYVAGRADAALPGQVHAGGPDAFLRKYDHLGNELWTRQFGTPTFDSARGVATRDSVVYMNGFTLGSLPGQLNAGAFDVFIGAYTADGGEELWTRQFGSELIDDSWGISADASALYVVGSVGGSLPGLESHGATDAFVAKLVDVLFVEIDIKPGDYPNTINVGSLGVVPVAILSSGAFDASTVDPATVTLANAGVALRGRGTLMASLEDVNGDGLPDLIVHIATDALELTSGDVEAVLTGRTFTGRHIRGVDTVRVVP